jgi:ribosomal protein L28
MLRSKSLKVIKTETCQLCGKAPRVGYNRPKSLHKTQRVILPNLQKWNGLVICSRCRKTLNKKSKPAA